MVCQIMTHPYNFWKSCFRRILFVCTWCIVDLTKCHYSVSRPILYQYLCITFLVRDVLYHLFKQINNSQLENQEVFLFSSLSFPYPI